MFLYSVSICAQYCSCLFLTLLPGSWGRGCYRALLKSALTSSSSPLALWVLWLADLLVFAQAEPFPFGAFLFRLVESVVCSFELPWRQIPHVWPVPPHRAGAAPLQRAGPEPSVPAPGDKAMESPQPRHLALTAPAGRKGGSFRKFPALDRQSTSPRSSWR